jgi:Fe-S cluster biogenesis protein NfuA
VTAPDLRAAGERIEQLLEELRSHAPPEVWSRAEEALMLVTQLYGASLARVVELGGPDFLARLVDDDLVASLLIVHDLHPFDVTTRVENALVSVRPYLGTHGGNVSVEAVDASRGVVRLRMLGSCDGCPSSSVTLKLAVERAIFEAAPEITSIEVVDEEGKGVGGPRPVSGTPIALGKKPVSVGHGVGG